MIFQKNSLNRKSTDAILPKPKQGIIWLWLAGEDGVDVAVAKVSVDTNILFVETILLVLRNNGGAVAVLLLLPFDGRR